MESARRFGHTKQFANAISRQQKAWNPKFSPAAQFGFKGTICLFFLVTLHDTDNTHGNICTSSGHCEMLELVTCCNRVHKFQQRTMKKDASGGPQRVKAIVKLYVGNKSHHENALEKLYPQPENCTLATRPEKLYPRKIVPSLKLKKKLWQKRAQNSSKLLNFRPCGAIQCKTLIPTG